jgi:hypothetical protein
LVTGSSVAGMANSGPQAPGVTFHEAYRFSAGAGDDHVEGTVFKALPRRIVWEARIDDTTIAATGETRRDAVEHALADLREQRRAHS